MDIIRLEFSWLRRRESQWIHIKKIILTRRGNYKGARVQGWVMLFVHTGYYSGRFLLIPGAANNPFKKFEVEFQIIKK